MLAESHDEEQIIARVAALDIGKADWCVVCAFPHSGPKRLQEVSTHSTMPSTSTWAQAGAVPANRAVAVSAARIKARGTALVMRVMCLWLSVVVKGVGQRAGRTGGPRCDTAARSNAERNG